MELRALGQPALDKCGLMGPVVVHHDMDVELRGHCCLDAVQEFPERHGAVTAVAGGQHLSSPDGRYPELAKPTSAAQCDKLISSARAMELRERRRSREAIGARDEQ